RLATSGAALRGRGGSGAGRSFAATASFAATIRCAGHGGGRGITSAVGLGWTQDPPPAARSRAHRGAGGEYLHEHPAPRGSVRRARGAAGWPAPAFCPGTAQRTL